MYSKGVCEPVNILSRACIHAAASKEAIAVAGNLEIFYYDPSEDSAPKMTTPMYVSIRISRKRSK